MKESRQQYIDMFYGLIYEKYRYYCQVFVDISVFEVYGWLLYVDSLKQISNFLIRYNTNDEASIQLYYLNFNRIDMKKQLLSRKKNSSAQGKPENYTKASSKKHHRNRLIKKKLNDRVIKPVPNIESIPVQDDETMKNESDTAQLATDIPENVNLQDYIHDIDHHIVSIDKQFHGVLEQKLKIAGHIQITSEMRKILIKWLLKVSLKFRIKQESIHICVQLIDYMLINNGDMFNKTNFQLLGVACLFISCKYNQIYTLDALKYIQLCDGIYSIAQLFEMQGIILCQLNFNLQVPTLYQFINKMVFDFKITTEQQSFIKTIVDLSIFDFNILNTYRKYDLAIAILYFTSKLNKLDSLKEELMSLKMKICPQIFKKCFVSVMSLFRKSHGSQNQSISI